MSYRKAKSAGFTLVEILIVVVILGILAAIVIPQFTNASQAAKASQLTAQLQTIRSQLELSQIEHQGAYPDLTGTLEAGWADLIQETEGDSAYTLATAATDNPVGPYLQKPPVNSFFDGTATTSVGAANTNAWIYDSTSGSIAANASSMTTAQAEDLGLDVIKAVTEKGDVYTSDNAAP